jgi:hypothetical protein
MRYRNRKRTIAAAAALALLVSSACAPAGRSDAVHGDIATGERAVPQGLATSLQVEQLADSVRFALRVTNATAEPVNLTFSSGQSFDFVVEREGREVWRWSDDMMFTQAIRQETMAPGATRNYGATWVPPRGASGRYTVRGVLTAREHPVEQRAEFQLR